MPRKAKTSKKSKTSKRQLNPMSKNDKIRSLEADLESQMQKNLSLQQKLDRIEQSVRTLLEDTGIIEELKKEFQSMIEDEVSVQVDDLRLTREQGA